MDILIGGGLCVLKPDSKRPPLPVSRRRFLRALTALPLVGAGIATPVRAALAKRYSFLRRGQLIPSHRHNFGHVTVVNRGAITFAPLKTQTMHVSGWPAKAETLFEKTVRATDRENWFFIEQGVFHILRVEEDDSDYGCFYAHRLPQALSHIDPGQHQDPAQVKRDEFGLLWVRVDESIVQHHTGWPEAYR